MKSHSWYRLRWLGVVIVLGFLLGMSGLDAPNGEGAPGQYMPRAQATPEIAYASFKPNFAPFKDPTVRVELRATSHPVEANLQNVLVPFVLSAEQRRRLERDGLVVSPGEEKEFYTLYEKIRYNNQPIFVTSDSLLHIYHLLFDKVLRQVEREHLLPRLVDFNTALLSESDALYQEMPKGKWKDAALRVVAYVGVASRLLDREAWVPPYAEGLVTAQVELIEEARGVRPSPVFSRLTPEEDYTQYIPRGHYAADEPLGAYFRAMTWYGRMMFHLAGQEEIVRSETRMALVLTHALRRASVEEQPALEVWEELYAPIAFFTGYADDLAVVQYGEVLDVVFGPEVNAANLADDEKLDAFIQEARRLPVPRVLGMAMGSEELETGSATGLRLMGQRFVPDAYLFRQLVWSNVGDAKVHRRGLPKGLDLLAAMGSERAYTLLEGMGETNYVNYPERMAAVRSWLGNVSVEEHTETLYTTWLYTLKPLLAAPGDGYPAFMRSSAWQDRQLNAALGSWVELKHDTVLLGQPIYAERGGGGPMAPEPVVLRGYVEPVPLFYARLVALIDMTLEGLDRRKLLTMREWDSLQRLKELTVALQAMAEKELRAEPLTQQEYETILYYGADLEQLTMAAADAPERQSDAIPMLDEETQAAVVADVATDADPDGDGVPNPLVLQAGVGRVNELYAVVPMVSEDGNTYLQVAKGGVFSYYEFTWPADERLTDDRWRQMLDEDVVPPAPEWTESFVTEQTEQTQLQQTISTFQTALTWAYWDLELDTYLPDEIVDAQVREQLRPEIEALRAANQYIGHQLVSSDYRSYDRQTSRKAVVTVRETWQDGLYEVVEFFGDGESAPVSQRGPYALDVTYTLEKGKFGWLVTKVVYANQPPEWVPKEPAPEDRG